MLTRDEIRSHAEETASSPALVERDYLQHLALLGIGRHVASELVLAGGGSLQKTLGLPRLSEDIDFVQRSEVHQDQLVRWVQRSFTSFGYRSQVSPSMKTPDGWQRRFRIEGPLYDGGVHSAASVRIDVTLRDDLLRPPRTVLLTPRYRDVPPYTLSALQPEELAAAKAVALLRREKARDLYDLWFLVTKGVRFDRDLLAARLGAAGGRSDHAALTSAVRRKRELWKPELGPLVSPLPAFDVASGAVLPALEAVWPEPVGRDAPAAGSSRRRRS